MNAVNTEAGAAFRVVKSLNSSVILAVDTDDHEWLLLGKGIGYGRRPGDNVDPGLADRAFIPLSKAGTADHIRALSFLTPERLAITEEIVHLAERRLGVALDRYILVALTDHLAFVLERARSGAPIAPSLSWEVEDLYPDEYAVATEALTPIEQRTSTRLPPEEAVSITLHLVNAEQPDSDMPAVAKLSEFLDWFARYIDTANVRADRKARNRLLRHGRSLYQRVLSRQMLSSDVGDLLEGYRVREPRVMACVDEIAEHIRIANGVALPDEEQLHLALYLRAALATTS